MVSSPIKTQCSQSPARNATIEYYKYDLKLKLSHRIIDVNEIVFISEIMFAYPNEVCCKYNCNGRNRVCNMKRIFIVNVKCTTQLPQFIRNRNPKSSYGLNVRHTPQRFAILLSRTGTFCSIL